MSKMPKCIRCGSNRAVYHDGDRNYYCTSCKIVFDDEPDEGGDWSNRPSQRLEREEAKRERNLGRRRG